MKNLRFFFLFILLPIVAYQLHSETVPLGGSWKFALDTRGVGNAEKWYLNDLQEDFRLPGSNVENMQGFDIALDTKFTGSIYDSSWYFNPFLEKYRQPGNIKVPFWLTQNKYYQGYAWYQRQITIPAGWKNRHIELYLERAHIISTVWINDTEAGSCNSLTTPHIYDLTHLVEAGKTYKLTICMDNQLKNTNVGANSHSVTDHTQGNWNGIVGAIELREKPLIHAADIQVFPDLKNKKALVKLKILNSSRQQVKGNIILEARSFNTKKSYSIRTKYSYELAQDSSSGSYSIPLFMGSKMQTWDEFHPALYRLKVIVQTADAEDITTLQFGMREITIQGKWIYINGRKTMMRGTVENALFPLTGYPPTNVESWKKVFNICKSYGLNHMRFHSNCPPEAAFQAADLVGMYLQPEGPSWPNHSTQLGRGYFIDTYLMDETKSMVRHYGNYASFVMLAAGNEPRGNWVPWASRFVDYWKSADSRRIYTGASVGGSWAWQPKNQYHVKAGARGLDWSRSQPESMSDFLHNIDTVSQPFISHETGQWCVFPDFTEIPKYTGVTRAKNFELFREEFEKNDLQGLDREFLRASGNLQVLCYKHEIEKTLRTPGYAGFQLLGLNDFSGQGTALVGVLNAFWEEKGYVTADKFRRFCSATVPLIRTKKFVYQSDEKLRASVEFAHFGEKIIKKADVLMRLKSVDGKIILEKDLIKTDIPVGNNIPAGNIELDLSGFKKAVKVNLEILIAGTEIINDWNFWIYPAQQTDVDTTGIYITTEMDVKAEQILENGGRVLILAADKITYGKDVVQQYQPVFWNTSWFKMRPPHTTGVYIRNLHPVFKNFVTDDWADMQWWELVNRTQTMLLTDFPKGFQPIVQPIDTWFINRKLGMLFEARAGKGKLMMTSMNLSWDPAHRPVAADLYRSIISYMQSAGFNPAMEVSLENIRDLFTKKAAPINFYSRSSPDELKQGKI